MDWGFWWVLGAGALMGGFGALVLRAEMDLARRQQRADDIYAREVELAKRRHPAYKGNREGRLQ